MLYQTEHLKQTLDRLIEQVKYEAFKLDMHELYKTLDDMRYDLRDIEQGIEEYNSELADAYSWQSTYEEMLLNAESHIEFLEREFEDEIDANDKYERSY